MDDGGAPGPSSYRSAGAGDTATIVRSIPMGEQDVSILADHALKNVVDQIRDDQWAIIDLKLVLSHS